MWVLNDIYKKKIPPCLLCKTDSFDSLAKAEAANEECDLCRD